MINSKDKVLELQSLIVQRILPLIDNDYVLYGLPYYTNIGDILIWNGEKELLKRIPYKCLGVCSLHEIPQFKLKKDTIILITGGGYWGDVWRDAFENMLNAIQGYKENKIIFLPASIYYADEDIMRQDAQYMSDFKHLTICVRDKVSFEYVNRHFSNHAILVPDMAFYINASYLKQWIKPTLDKVLYLKRIDKELVDGSLVINENNIDIHDWPTMDEEMSLIENICYKVLYRTNRLGKYKYLTVFSKRFRNFIYNSILRHIMTKRGVQFISSYKKVYTTRLHVLILSVLLDKEVILIDNSTGKLSAFYHTWLKNLNSVSEYKK